MGQFGEFKEYQYTGSLSGASNRTEYYDYNPVASVSNPPMTGGLFINDTNDHQGQWQTIFVISASNFTALSGSYTIPPGNVVPTATVLKGTFTDIKLASGLVVAFQGATT